MTARMIIIFLDLTFFFLLVGLSQFYDNPPTKERNVSDTITIQKLFSTHNLDQKDKKKKELSRIDTLIEINVQFFYKNKKYDSRSHDENIKVFKHDGGISIVLLNEAKISDLIVYVEKLDKGIYPCLIGNHCNEMVVEVTCKRTSDNMYTNNKLNLRNDLGITCFD